MDHPVGRITLLSATLALESGEPLDVDRAAGLGCEPMTKEVPTQIVECVRRIDSEAAILASRSPFPDVTPGDGNPPQGFSRAE